MIDHETISCRAPLRHRRRRRHGMMIIAALVCLLVVMSIVASMLKFALRTRRELHTERDLRQTELLVEAGADRASARLAAQPDFRGDVWELPASAIVDSAGGRVTTEISPNSGQQSWQVRVSAEYPLGRDFPIHRSRTFQIPLSKPQSQE